MSAMVTVRVEQVTLGYAGADGPRVLEGVTCSAVAGTVTALVGPNASGKTSLLRAIGGHLPPLEGRLTVAGAEPHRLSGRALAQSIAWVPQRGTVSAPMSAREVVTLGRFALSPAPQRIDRALEAVAMVDQAERPFAELSAGQQQRVLLARALAQLEPEGLLLLDEPTAAMDLPSAQRTLRVLRDAARGGATIIIALHDLLAAQRVADRVWLFAGGRVVAEGDVQAMLQPSMLQEVFGVPFLRAVIPGEGELPVPADAPT